MYLFVWGSLDVCNEPVGSFAEERVHCVWVLVFMQFWTIELGFLLARS